MKRAIPQIRFIDIKKLEELIPTNYNSYRMYIPGGDITFQDNEVFRILTDTGLLESVYIYKDGYIIPYNNDELVKYYVLKELTDINIAVNRDNRELSRSLYDPIGKEIQNGE